jgi:ubiquinone/menaquinone biosynthesis C-methylase UbiE
MLALDVGCGNKPRGDINVDKYRYTNETENQNPRKYVKTRCNVIATGEYLPFKDKTFDLVMSIHSIEHSSHPKDFLLELKRVCKEKGKIKIECPHRMSREAKMLFHRSYLDENFFIRILGNCNIKVMKEPVLPSWFISNRFIRYAMRKSFPIKRPTGITIEYQVDSHSHSL